MKRPTLSIVLPTYNESQSIVKIIKTIHVVCKNISHEIIVVDDHSPDNTLTIIKKNPSVRSFMHPGPRGLGLSILYGIKKAHGAIIIGMDADGNHDPSIIPTLIKKLNHADLVVASRFLKGGGMHSLIRYWTSFIFNLLLRIGFGFPITDNTSGYYAIRKSTLVHKLNPAQIYYGYGDYHLRLVWTARKIGLTIVETPIYYGKRFGGTSKSHFFSMSLAYLRVATQLKGSV